MRIGTGQFRGRRLLSPPGSGTRPITGLVKKSLFGMLRGRLEAAAVVDLYCGTGTLGLEAISQGAGRCWFAERDPRVVERLRRNIETLGVTEQCTIWRGDVMRRLAKWLATVDAPVDIAFVDPPYPVTRGQEWKRAGKAVFAPLAARLADDGVIVLRLEGKAAAPDPPEGLAIARARRYGDMQLILMERPEAAS